MAHKRSAAVDRWRVVAKIRRRARNTLSRRRPVSNWFLQFQLLTILQCLCHHDMTASYSVVLRTRPFAGSASRIWWLGRGSLRAAKMTGDIQSEKTPRKRFLEAALKELEKFERRENDFLKKERRDRAVELKVYLDNFTSRRPGRLF